jgi:MarR family transcriptional regulator, organic hydroperoxide resistance regulator
VPTTTDAELAAFAAALDDFLRAGRRARGRLHPEGDDAVDLSLSQYYLLEPLAVADGPLCLGELALAAGVSAPTATRMLDGLEREGLVRRERRADDRRLVAVALTEAGRERVDAARARVLARRREIFESLAPAERRGAARLLERLAAAVEGLR